MTSGIEPAIVELSFDELLCSCDRYERRGMGRVFGGGG
jgi:hypothetical protein